MSNSRDLHDLTRRPPHLLCREDVAAAGLSVETIDAEVRAGRIERLQRGIYVPVAVAGDRVVRMCAALRAAGPGAALSHRAAAQVHEVSIARSEDLIEILVLHGRLPTVRGAIVHRTRRLPEHHVVSVDGMAVTSVERTLADLGAVVPPWVVARSVEQAVIARKTSIERLYRMADEHGRQGRTGISALRSTLDDWVLGDARPDSALEVMFARLIERAELPMPEFQYPIRDGGRTVAKVDACWPSHWLVAEVDGLHAHATAAALDNDLARQNMLVALGYVPLRFTWRHIVRDPDSVASVLAELPPTAASDATVIVFAPRSSGRCCRRMRRHYDPEVLGGPYGTQKFWAVFRRM